jgi:hypothetical protein
MDKLEQMKAIAADGVLEVNGRVYKIGKYTHAKRVKVLASFSMLDSGNLTCLGTPDFVRGEQVFMSNLIFDDMAVSRIDGHFEKYPEDYLTVMALGMGAVCVPFGVGKSATDSPPSIGTETL